MVKRQRDARGPSYPPYQVGEPVAGNCEFETMCISRKKLSSKFSVALLQHFESTSVLLRVQTIR